MNIQERIAHYEDQLEKAEKKLAFVNVPCPSRDRLEGVVQALRTELAGLYQKVS